MFNRKELRNFNQRAGNLAFYFPTKLTAKYLARVLIGSKKNLYSG